MASRTSCDICGQDCTEDLGMVTIKRLDDGWADRFWRSYDLCSICIRHVRRLTKTGLTRISPCPTCGNERLEDDTDG